MLYQKQQIVFSVSVGLSEPLCQLLAGLGFTLKQVVSEQCYFERHVRFEEGLPLAIREAGGQLLTPNACVEVAA